MFERIEGDLPQQTVTKRKPLYLSPSAIDLWIKNQDDYYQRYLAPVKPMQEPQTQPMSIGSALDAYAKAAFIKDLKNIDTFDDLFVRSVEIHNRDWALENGKKLFQVYKDRGHYQTLLKDLEASPVEPRFEFELTGKIAGVPLLGKPDVFYYTADGKPVILDYKVNGYCANDSKSPMAGYIYCSPDSRNHPDVIFENYGKHKKYNCNKSLNKANSSWGAQLAMYAWLCGVNVGDSFLAEIHQFVGNPKLTDSKGNLKPVRIAIHASMVDANFQEDFMRTAVNLWDRVNSDHFFRELSKEESDRRCEFLNISSNPEVIFNLSKGKIGGLIER